MGWGCGILLVMGTKRKGTPTMTHTTTITPEPATKVGALDGFRVDCSECGFIGSSSIESTARLMYAEGHRRYMEDELIRRVNSR